MCGENECGCDSCGDDEKDCEQEGDCLLIESFLDQLSREEKDLMRELVEGDCYKAGVAGSRKLLIALLTYLEQNLTEVEKILLSAGVQNPTISVKGSGINLYCSYEVAKEVIRDVNKLREYTIFFPVQNKRTGEIKKIGMALKREIRERVHDKC